MKESERATKGGHAVGREKYTTVSGDRWKIMADNISEDRTITIFVFHVFCFYT